MHFRLLLSLLVCCAVGSLAAADSLFDKANLAAWCIVPFDAKKRGPEERAAMLEWMGVKKFVYDYRKEHIAQWDEELAALKRHGIELLGWWFPTSLNEEAKAALALFRRHGVKPQLWVSGNGGTIEGVDAAEQKARVEKEIARLKPIALAAAEVGCQVALYNHGAWFGEPENAIAIVEALKAAGVANVGLVYNLHHGHGHLVRLESVLLRMRPHLLCFNLNGMDVDGEAKGRKILPLGAGSEDGRVLRLLRASGYAGPVGILNHTDADAEGRLLDNLDGLAWLLKGAPAGEKPKYRTWSDAPAKAPRKTIDEARGVPSLSEEFGLALAGGLLVEERAEYHTLPITIECRAKLESRERFNILVACHPKAASTHWELYTRAKTGTLALFLPGRGGDYDSGVDVCDGQWHDVLASIDDAMVSLWVDGRLVLEKVPPAPGAVRAAKTDVLAFGRLVEGGLGCDGILDDVRLSRGVMKPRNGGAPRLRMDNTLGHWSFDDLGAGQPVVRAPEPAAFAPDRRPLRTEDQQHWEAFVNRDRVFDFYAKQALAFMTAQPMPELLPAYPGLDGGRQGHWGNQNDAVTWKDGRWAAADHGTIFSAVFKGGGLTIPKGVCVRFDDRAACFDPTTLSFPIVWSGGFIRLSDARHGFMSAAQMDGDVVKKDATKNAGEYHGFYRHGKEVIFAHSSGGVRQLVNARGDDAAKLEPLTRGGPAQWPQWLETRGVRGGQLPFATDTIPIPFENPYGTLFFLSGHDFFSDGTAAVATMTGEVWLVRGIDEGLEKLRWKRFATGLHQPLGVKIVGDKLHVLGRDQITRLHDLNGDDEADYYECVTNGMVTSPGGHDYTTGLEADAQGRWYFASAEQGVCRVTGRDRLDVLATGFRNPNGLGLSPDARFVTTSVQEGDWTPASAICQIAIGKNEGAHFGAGGPKKGEPELPLLQLPRGEDNSAGGQCFLPDGAWPALRGEGNLIHTSTGSGSVWLVMRQQVGERWQAAAVRMSGNFESGVQAGRFHPRDGHFYATGMQGWGSYTPRDGCFQRVRFTGGVPVPMACEARDNGVLLRFDTALDATLAGAAAHHFAQCWNYRYSATYGSPEYSLRFPDTPGHDPIAIRSAQVLEGGRALFLEMPQLVPASQIHLHVRVTAGRAHDVFLTAHALAAPFTAFPGYTAIPKTAADPHAGHHAAISAAVQPVPWEQGEPGRELRVQAATGLQFAQKELRAKAGERLTLHFDNPDVMPHNWVLIRPDATERVGELANKLIAAPDALTRHYVPASPDVLCHTRILDPQKHTAIHFTAPAEPGRYPYLCTFPGHWMIMRGVLVVEGAAQ